MANRPLMVATLLGASIGVPYVMSRTSQSESPGGRPDAARPTWSIFGFDLAGNRSLAPPPLGGPGAPAYDNPVPLEDTRFHSLAEVLRFDVTREWVYRNWARKSTGLSDPEMFGVRVALVTGTGLSDLAGSLTYHFNRQGQVQHISFRGRTADTTQLVQFLTSTYKFERVEAPAGEQCYHVRRGSRVMSELRTWPEPVLWSNSPHGSFFVGLSLERPGSNRTLPPRTPQLEIPAAAATAASPASGGEFAADKSAETAGENVDEKPALIGNIRPATRAEEGLFRWKRWPN